MDKLYAKLSEQHLIMQQQKGSQKSSDDEALFSSCSSLPITPAAEGFPAQSVSAARTASTTPNDNQAAAEEILRLKLELAQAQTKITRLDRELAQTRLASQEAGRATPALTEPDFLPSISAISASPAASRISGGSAINIPGKISFVRENNWMTQDEARSDISDSLSAGGFNRARGIWNNNKAAFANPFPQNQAVIDGTQPLPWPNSRTVNPDFDSSFATSGMDMYRQDRVVPEHDVVRPMGRRGHRYDNRYGFSNNFAGGFGGFNMGAGPYESVVGYGTGPQAAMAGGMGMGLCPPYQQQPVGTALSPHATEFTSAGAPWKAEVSD